MGKIQLKQGKSIYILSDFHLGFPSYKKSQEKEKKIVSWLSSIQDHTSDLIILGDAFDFWFEYKKVVPKGFIRFLGKLAEFADQGIHLHFFAGNHDLWLKDYLPSEMAITIYHQAELFEIKGHSNSYCIEMGHGDGLGFDQFGYKFLRKVYTNPLAKTLFNWLHPDIGIKLAHHWSNTRKYSSMKSNKAWEDFNPEKDYIIDYIRHKLRIYQASSQKIDAFIFGHRHCLIDYDCGDGTRYINLGDWIMEDYANAGFVKIQEEGILFDKIKPYLS